MICNAGLVTGFQRVALQNIIDPLVSEYDIIMLPNKSYCFIEFHSVEDAISVYDKIHGHRVNEGSVPLYASFTESGI